jgi:hypothetical protein
MPGFSQQLLDEAPKALWAALIPLLQFAWRWSSNHSRESRKEKLIARIKELSEQKVSFGPFLETPSGSLLLNTMDAEIDDSIHELVQIRAARHQRLTAGRSRFATWFLLFTPCGLGAWAVHMLFFANLGIVLLGILGVASDWKTDSDHTSGILGMVIFTIPMFIFRAIAIRLDTRSQVLRQAGILPR